MANTPKTIVDVVQKIKDYVNGLFPLSVSNGGTGATSASTARTNLGLGTAAQSNTTASITNGSTDIPTSGAVYDVFTKSLGVVRVNMSGSESSKTVNLGQIYFNDSYPLLVYGGYRSTSGEKDGLCVLKLANGTVFIYRPNTSTLPGLTSVTYDSNTRNLTLSGDLRYYVLFICGMII